MLHGVYSDTQRGLRRYDGFDLACARVRRYDGFDLTCARVRRYDGFDLTCARVRRYDGFDLACVSACRYDGFDLACARVRLDKKHYLRPEDCRHTGAGRYPVN